MKSFNYIISLLLKNNFCYILVQGIDLIRSFFFLILGFSFTFTYFPLGSHVLPHIIISSLSCWYFI